MPEKGNKLLFALLGCAAVCLLGLCGATGVAVYLLMRDGGPLFTEGGEQTSREPGDARPPVGQPPPELPRLRVAAEVTSVDGNVVPSGSRCLFDLEPPADSQSLCRAQVVCGGQLVYGGQRAGYFPCTVTSGKPLAIAGRDDQSTAEDGDAAMAIDTAARTLTVRDDERGFHGAFELEARIESVE